MEIWKRNINTVGNREKKTRIMLKRGEHLKTFIGRMCTDFQGTHPKKTGDFVRKNEQESREVAEKGRKEKYCKFIVRVHIPE